MARSVNRRRRVLRTGPPPKRRPRRTPTVNPVPETPAERAELDDTFWQEQRPPHWG
ncbi:hypothetical protein KRX51_06655 [Corynebacterium sp. TAE3-ERU12]|uniref:hypothetical protein n=1 Tax=Corynebacterium sp. TAE3-ERU12 TaxID=2849491 RepID=UPI001C44494C|nr:hypothetical protein [Corynebacterium sp. TAE3-ERU12]MBV7295597.1 hypothetical protein [Corynebacterium sp. TAE3-ERU12]